jgi:hypothetical protein
MRQTNFSVGRLNAGYDTNYNNTFVGYSNTKRKIINKDDKNKLEASHWDHSRSWSQNFRTEQLKSFTEKKDPINF